MIASLRRTLVAAPLILAVAACHTDSLPTSPEASVNPDPVVAAGAVAKIAVCHVPPGDPENARTLHVSSRALRAHLAHGDSEGECGAGGVYDFESGPPLPADFVAGGDSPWFVSDVGALDGVYSARSGDIGNNQVSTLELAVTCTGGAASVAFDWEVSSESFFDDFRFLVDGSTILDESGRRIGALVEPLGDGPHTLEWIYDKDGSVSSYEDAAWVDNIVLEGCVPA